MSPNSSEEFEKQTNRKIIGYLSLLYFDSQPVITGIVNKLLDFCVRPGLIIASSIINHIIDEKESIMHLDCQLSRKYTNSVRAQAIYILKKQNTQINIS